MFGTEDLNLKQLNELVTELKKPGVQPPGGLVARDPIVIMRDNPSNYTGTDKSRVYLGKNRVGIQFADMPTAMNWAYKLMVKTGLPWEKALHRFRVENMPINFFHHIWSQKLNLAGLCGLSPGSFELDPQLVTHLHKLTTRWRRITTPYPDSTPLKRVYHSLGKGDKLLDTEGNEWEIQSTRPSLTGPQEILLEPANKETTYG